ncbi:MAG: phosphatase PAP2 family protein [Muribaculaceae bacterium]|nr:phosphatase PAP2 family protein [Muribaculaceae bacterium]
MTRLFLTLFLMAALPLGMAAQSAEVTIEDNDIQTVTSEMNDTVAVVDTISEQTNAAPSLTGDAGDFYLLKERDKYRVYNGPDFHFLKNTTNPAVKPYKFMNDQTFVGIPVFLAGLIAKSEKTAFRQDYRNTNEKIRLVKYNFHSEIDNYTQFSGIALTVGLKMAGVEGRSSWPRLFASSLASYAVMAGFVNGIKYTASEMRPDGSTRNSWPSGHTATAFVGATILHKEYGLTRSPWYSVAGYTLATGTGVMRVLNNRHWISDVLSGAGIGILSTELAYGICDLLFKQKGLLMNDLAYYTDLSKNPSFFSISMGIGLGNKHLILPAFDFGLDEQYVEHDAHTGPLEFKFRSATAVGAEGAWFFNPYIGIGARLRVKTTPINGWSTFAQIDEKSLNEILEDPEFKSSIKYFGLEIESDHITEFAADAGIYLSWPLSSRFAIGSKVLVGRSIMDDIYVGAKFYGDQMDYDAVNDRFIPTDEVAYCDWEFISVSASNSMKFGTGLSLTYSYKNSFSWRLFCDYDYAKKTYRAQYAPFMYIGDFSPAYREEMKREFNWDPCQTFTSSAQKKLNQWVLGGALCVSF